MMKNNSIIYQLALRSFTPEGTLKAAKKLISHIASLGVDIVYISPFFVQDEDSDVTTWSKRQCLSGTYNPKNPYKIADFFNVDPEYGTSEDVKELVNEIHKYGMKAMFDLVYMHCGRNAVFAKEHPEYYVRNDDGSFKIPEGWPFPRLNFENKELREYMLSNVAYLVNEFDADGFRCDMGDYIPLDFWKEAFDSVKVRKPGLITLNEGEAPDSVNDVFDCCYGKPGQDDCSFRKTIVNIFTRKKPATELMNFYNANIREYGENHKKLLLFIDNHDTASDSYMDRLERVLGTNAIEAALVIGSTYPGITFLWNGYEFCDDSENCMFSNRYHGKRSAIDWSKAFTDEGMERLAFIKKINAIRHESHAIENGKLGWIENDIPEHIISYARTSEKQQMIVVVNTKDSDLKTCLKCKGDINLLISRGAELCGNEVCFEPYGYIVAVCERNEKNEF